MPGRLVLTIFAGMGKSTTPMGLLTLRIDGALRGELEAAAERDRRPVGNLMRLALADWLAQRSADQQQQRAEP